jgi:hypothetical protein
MNSFGTNVQTAMFNLQACNWKGKEYLHVHVYEYCGSSFE